jgi:NACalpha-BTF3-like transcription factor
MVKNDGSVWLHHRGEVRRVAPPGTDHHTVRFVTRALPAMDLVWRRLREDRGDAADDGARDHRIAEEVVDLVDGDDVALVMAQAFAGRVGLEKVTEAGDLAEAARWYRVVDVLDSAVRQAQQAGLPETGRDEIRDAVAAWREEAG